MEFEKFNNIFKKIAFIILILVVLTMPISNIVSKISFSKEDALIAEYGAESAEVEAFETIPVLELIYKVNCVLCVVSILLFITYLLIRFLKYKNIKLSKEIIIKKIPIVLLSIFMIWTLVGCLEVILEVNAEEKIRNTENKEEISKITLSIANWSETERPKNGIDVMWNGYKVSKDGLFSYLFYAAVFLNIIIIWGSNIEKYKNWILRTLLIVSFTYGLLIYISFYERQLLYNIVFWNRGIYDNSNHLGFYISIVYPFTLVSLIKEKNMFFKVVSFLSALVYIPVLIVNNTFGTYLAICVVFLFVGIIVLLNLIKNFNKEKIIEASLFSISLIAFIISSNVIQNAFCNTYYQKNGNKYSYAMLWLNIGDKTKLYTFNSVSEEKAKELNMQTNQLNGEIVKWGRTVSELNKKSESTMVSRNFEKLFKDLGIWKDFYLGDNKDTELNENGLSEDISNTGSGRGDVWIGALRIINQRPLFRMGTRRNIKRIF